MARPLKQVVAKFLQLREVFERLYEVEAKKYMHLGFTRDEAFEKVAYEVDIDFDRIREMEKGVRLEYACTCIIQVQREDQDL